MPLWKSLWGQRMKVNDMIKDLIIVGASGFGREVAWLVERINAEEPTWNLLGFLDDNSELAGKKIDDYNVLGTSEAASDYPDTWYVCAIGSSKIRKNVVEKLGNVKFATLVDPSVIISKRVSIGEGTIICSGNIITVDIIIRNHVIINLDCTIGHDAFLNDFVTLYPSVNVSGFVTIGETTEIGTGVQIIQNKNIGSNTIVGAGAVVIKDIPECCTAVGNPAKLIK